MFVIEWRSFQPVKQDKRGLILRKNVGLFWKNVAEKKNKKMAVTLHTNVGDIKMEVHCDLVPTAGEQKIKAFQEP